MKRWQQALRALARRPQFAIAVVLILASGIAANTAVFSIVDAVLLKPLPYPDPDRLVTVMEASSAARNQESLIAPPRLEDWNRMNRTFDAIAGSYAENVTDTSSEEPERLAGRRVSPRYFDVFNTKTVIGRTFTADEEVFGGPPAAVISYDFWERRFHRDPGTVGKRLILKDRPFTIVGVMPKEFAGSPIDLWMPAALVPFLMRQRDARFYGGVGRMKPGVTILQAQADIAHVQKQLGEQFPQTDRDWSALVGDLKEFRVGSHRRALFFVFGAVGLLLLIAVANVAALILAQLHRRERELAIRNSIGGTRGQVIGAVMREVWLVCAAGVAAGGALSTIILRLLSKLTRSLPHSVEFALDWRAFVFAAAAGTLAALVCGLLPAIHVTRADLASILAHGGRGVSGDRQNWQRVLVTAQIALTLMLLASTGLMLRSYYNLARVEVGFDPSQSVTFHVGAAWDEDRKRVGELQKDLLEKFQALPGVTAAGFANFLPASQATLRYQMELEGIARTEESGKINVGERSISGGYLSAIGAPLLAGTWCPELKAIDTKSPKALVNRRLVEMYANGRNVVGRHFRFADFPPNYPPIEIVGVVGDVREDSVSAAPVAYVYWCIMPGGWPDPDYVVRTRGNPRALLAQIRSVVHDVEPTRAVFGAQPLQNAIDASWEQTRLNTELVTVFGAAALGLASIGLYGLVTLIVTSHRREIGIRMALGAAPGRIVNEVASGVARLLMIGVAVGLVLTLVFQGVLRTVVFEVSPTDLVTLVCAVLLIFATAGAAALVPARRAARIDPATVIGTQL